jgi:hypothetical protein
MDEHNLSRKRHSSTAFSSVFIFSVIYNYIVINKQSEKYWSDLLHAK